MIRLKREELRYVVSLLFVPLDSLIVRIVLSISSIFLKAERGLD